MAGKLFLSFAWEDRALAWLLSQELDRRAVPHFNYVRDGHVGERPKARIAEELRGSAEMLMLLSPAGKRAPLLATEYGIAIAFGLQIRVGLHYLTLSETRQDRKWFPFVEDGAFELPDHLPAYLDQLEERHHGR